MSEYLGEHWIATVIITIILGAIGSALWDAGIKPYGAKFSSAVFSLITFGAKKARDGIYKQAAMGHHELPSLYILLIVTSFMFGAITISVGAIWSIGMPSPHFSVENDVCRSYSGDERKECISREFRTVLGPYVQVVAIVSLVSSIFIFRNFFSINKMNLINTYFEHCLRVVRPYLTELEAISLEQKFAFMAGKQDFDDLILEMSRIAEGNQVALPAQYV